MCQATLSLAARDLARRPNGACLGGSRRRAISADVNPRTVSCRMVAASGVAISRSGAPSSRRPRGSSLPHHCRTEEDRQRQQRQACRRPLTQHASARSIPLATATAAHRAGASIATTTSAEGTGGRRCPQRPSKIASTPPPRTGQSAFQSASRAAGVDRAPAGTGRRAPQ
jgi:hypothetical protein